eukprot:s1416_g8.t1
MAFAIKQSLPVSVTELLAGDLWRGGPLIQLEDTMSTARADDLVLNHCWANPVVQKFRDRVPSQFFLADVFICLHKLFKNKLLIPLEEGDSVESLAIDEAKKVKCLISGLRALWRSSISAQKEPSSESSDDEGPNLGDQGSEEPGEGSESDVDGVSGVGPLDGEDQSEAESEADSEATLQLPGNGDENQSDDPHSFPDESEENSTQADSDSGVTVDSTPKKIPEWREELFQTPQFGNSGPPRAEIIDMCTGLMQFFQANHREISQYL